MVRVDGFGVFLGVVVRRARPRCRCWSRSAYLRREQLEVAEYLVAHALLGARHGGDDHRQQPHRRVPRARDPVDPALRARRLRPSPAQLAGSRHQVLRARRVLVGDLPVRHRARVRRHRHHVAHRHRHVPARTTRCSSRARCSPGSCCCSSASASRWRRCRSTRGRPTCTRARPRRSPRSWRRPRRPPGSPRSCASSTVAFPLYRDRLAAGGVGARRAHARGRQHRRAAPDRRQAAARVLVDRARRLRAHGVRGRARPRAGKPRSSTCSSTRSWCIGSFAVVTVLAHAGRRRPLDRRLPRPRVPPTRAREPARLLHARAGRHPAHRRVRRQARGVLGRRRARASTCSSSIGAVATVIASFAYLRVALAVATPDERRRGRRAGAPPPGRRRHRGSCSRSPPASPSCSASCPAVFVALGPGRHAPHARHHLDPLAHCTSIRRSTPTMSTATAGCRRLSRRRGATRGGGAGDGGVRAASASSSASLASS